MANGFHEDQTGTEGIHVIHNYTYADATARGAASGFVAADVGKVALQQSDSTFWILTATTPTWVELTAAGGSGEANTASNVGTAGVGVFKQKTALDLEFKKINAGSSKVTITDDTGNDEIDIDVAEANIDHDALTNFVANEHIDWTVTGAEDVHDDRIAASSVTQHEASIDHDALTNFAANEHRIILQGVVASRPAAGTSGRYYYATDEKKWYYDNGVSWDLSVSEPDTHTHATTDITSGTFADARIAQSNVTQHEAAINHDNLTGFVANEHIDHTSVTLTAGEGLTGGGDISTNRSFAFDINGLTVDASPSAGNDYVATWDADAGSHKKVLLSSLPSGGQNNTASNVGVGGVGVFKQKTGVDLEFKNINAGSSKVTITDDTGNDEVDIDVAPANINHNDLGAHDGGTAGQYYHLTSAQHTVATQAATTSLNGYLSSTDWNTFNGKSDYSDPMTTTGDIIYRGAGGTTRLPIGTAGQVLTVSSGLPAWAAASGGGSGWGSSYSNGSESLSQSSTTATSLQTKLTWTTASLTSGDYILFWTYEYSINNAVVCTVEVSDGTTQFAQSIESPAAASQWYPGSGFAYLSSISGAKTFTIKYMSGGGGATAYIRNARLWLVNI